MQHRNDDPNAREANIITLPSIGSLTVFDLPDGPTPPPVIDNTFLTFEEVALVYAKAGTGKGLMACWMIHRAVEDGHNVMLYDAEFHRREYRTRLTGMGLTPEQMRMIHYRSPESDDWTAPKSTLSDAQALIEADCDKLNATILVVDSMAYAASGSADMGGQAAATEFIQALKRIGRTTAVLAHTAGNAGRFPPKPFGSIYAGAGAREMWAIEKVETEQIPYDRDTNDLQPAVVALELRNTKMSERAELPPQFLNFAFFPGGHIEANRPERTKTTMADLIAEVLGSTALTTKQIAAAIEEDTGERVTAKTIQKVFERDARQRFMPLDPNKRPHEWKRA